ncbi:unnamed protein product [Adineta steineri]|nr:unnamed protein product [Adineta steineri]CAF1375491.1 unnamed protein product [Adineta steineri]CAF1605536.1 unnamed protein product [Adineta steineri]
MQKKYKKGASVNYTSRNQALRKLQLTLADFRRLCILKGIYPVEPKNRRKANRGRLANKTYYLAKDIRFLTHEPIIDKFRHLKSYLRRVTKAKARNEKSREETLRNNRPFYKLDHVVRERYPSFADALRDLDDCLTLIFLFANFPLLKKLYEPRLRLCRRLSVEFLHYVIASGSIKKCFISVKGYYIQVEIRGEIITWIVPHKLGHKNPADVDFKIMATFLEFYTTLLGFVNFKLYSDLGLIYPPKLTFSATTSLSTLCSEDEFSDEFLASLGLPIMKKADANPVDQVEVDQEAAQLLGNTEGDEENRRKEEETKTIQKLFSKCKFFISREIPREMFAFVIRACGGNVSWDKTMCPGATYDVNDESITHQLVDRPKLNDMIVNRAYIQPQWVFDSINARKLLPVDSYLPGSVLPPHLSPFVEEKEGDYVPPERFGQRQPDHDVEEEITKQVPSINLVENNAYLNGNLKRKRKDEEETPVPAKPTTKEQRKQAMRVESGQVQNINVPNIVKRKADEEKRLLEMTIPKKQKRLYDKIKFSQKKKRQEVEKLTRKRANHENRAKQDTTIDKKK